MTTSATVRLTALVFCLAVYGSGCTPKWSQRSEYQDLQKQFAKQCTNKSLLSEKLLSPLADEPNIAELNLADREMAESFVVEWNRRHEKTCARAQQRLRWLAESEFNPPESPDELAHQQRQRILIKPFTAVSNPSSHGTPSRDQLASWAGRKCGENKRVSLADGDEDLLTFKKHLHLLWIQRRFSIRHRAFLEERYVVDASFQPTAASLREFWNKITTVCKTHIKTFQSRLANAKQEQSARLYRQNYSQKVRAIIDACSEPLYPRGHQEQNYVYAINACNKATNKWQAEALETVRGKQEEKTVKAFIKALPSILNLLRGGLEIAKTHRYTCERLANQANAKTLILAWKRCLSQHLAEKAHATRGPMRTCTMTL